MKTIDKKSILLIVVMVLMGSASFGLGRLSVLETVQAKDDVEIIVPKLADLTIDESKFAYVASRNGTKYYPIGCKSANRIKPENRVYFMNIEEAQDSGLTPTTSC